MGGGEAGGGEVGGVKWAARSHPKPSEAIRSNHLDALPPRVELRVGEAFLRGGLRDRSRSVEIGMEIGRYLMT